MKLAKLVGDDCLPWTLYDGTRVNISPGTIVQYERDGSNLYSVYFPGVQGYAPMSRWVFDGYFEPL